MSRSVDLGQAEGEGRCPEAPPRRQRMTVSVQIMRKTSQGMAPMLLMMPISWKRSKTDIRMVLTTPSMAIRMAIRAMEKTMTLAVETRRHDGRLDLGHADDLDVGQLVELVLELGHVGVLLDLDADGRDLALLVEDPSAAVWMGMKIVPSSWVPERARMPTTLYSMFFSGIRILSPTSRCSSSAAS